MPNCPSRSPLSAPLPEVRRSSCQNATAATTRSPTSAPARSGAGSARARPRTAVAAVSAGATTAAAQASAAAAPTSQTSAVGPVSMCSPILASGPCPASSRVSGPASSGAHTAAGRASSSASMAESAARRPRDAPRASSTWVSPARSVLSSRATSSSAYAASSTSCNETISSVALDTSSARSSWPRTSGSEVRAMTPPFSPGCAARNAWLFSAAVRRGPIRSAPNELKSAVASHDGPSWVIRPDPKAAVSVSNGPYVVNESLRTPRPPSSSSCQYGSFRSAGR